MTDQQTRRLQEIKQHSPNYLGVTTKAFTGKSRAAALKAKCLDCTGWQRKEITLCKVESCPLWLFRPYQSQDEPDDAQE